MKHADLPVGIWFFIRGLLALALLRLAFLTVNAFAEGDIVEGVVYVCFQVASAISVYQFLRWELGHRSDETPTP